MPDTTVVYFDSTMTGAPSLSTAAGALIGVLDACLQDGFGGFTLDSLAVADNIATATYSSGHGFTMQGETGPVILIAGATPSGLNGRWRVTVTSTTQFTFATSGISNQTATGTITAKRAPAGFTKVYSGTNIAAYRSDDPQGMRCYLRINDSAVSARADALMYESMSDIDTGTNPAPNTGTGYLSKYSTWKLLSDHRAFYFHIETGTGAYDYLTTVFFGDLIPHKSGDAYAVGWCPSANNDNTYLHHCSSSQVKWYLPRSYTGLGAMVTGYLFGAPAGSIILGGLTLTYPSPIDNSFHARGPIEVYESSAGLRGILPGIYNPLHTKTSLTNGLLVDDIPDLPGRTLMVLRLHSLADGGSAAFDLTGPWR